MIRRLSLAQIGSLWAILAFCAGLASAGLWFSSDNAWRTHQAGAFATGTLLYYTLVNGGVAPDGVTVTPLGPADRDAVEAGALRRLSMASSGMLITSLSIGGAPAPRATDPPGPSSTALSLIILSPDLVYPVSRVAPPDRGTPAETLGSVLRLLTTYCSDAILLAGSGGTEWVAIEGDAIWHCDAAPTDLRIIAGLLGVLSIILILAHVADVSGRFRRFAETLGAARKTSDPVPLPISGPAELEEAIDAVNRYFDQERNRLANRAMVLSGVSHDLGTPATRLRLRTALIGDEALRNQLERDIDQMTGMIESVLSYTRSELNAEAIQTVSLTALVQSIVDDYRDTGQPVDYAEPPPAILKTGVMVFAARPGEHEVMVERRLLASVRPLALRRAIGNLIDNALKYGRRATVSIEADPDRASILVEDQGAEDGAADIAALVAPFKRGANAAGTSGSGLGLTIVATVAEQHGGQLSFEQGRPGLRARLTIQRH